MKQPAIYAMPFGRIYPLYLQKVEKKNRTQSELNQVIFWLTGHDPVSLKKVLDEAITVQTFFETMPQLNPNAHLITGVICGHRVEDIEDPLMQKIRYLDKLVDELSKGRSMDRILRS